MSEEGPKLKTHERNNDRWPAALLLLAASAAAALQLHGMSEKKDDEKLSPIKDSVIVGPKIPGKKDTEKKPQSANVRLENLARALKQSPQTDAKMPIFNAETHWRERCLQVGSLIDSNKDSLARVILFLSKHTDKIADEKLRATFEKTALPYLGVHVSKSAGQASRAQLPSVEAVAKRVGDAGWWIRGCAEGIKAQKTFSNTQNFTTQYPANMGEIVLAILNAAKDDPEGPQIVLTLNELVAKLQK